MTAEVPLSLTHSPAPHGGHVGTAQIAFAVVAGPLAWFILVCAGEALASEPCFPGSHRYATPLPGLRWTWPALIALLVLCALVAFAAFAVSWRMYRVTRAEEAGRRAGLLDEGVGRTRFMALWGLLYGAGFCVATLLSLAAYIALPRCAG
ncbi:MAG: hypothetical protein JO203_08995 [Gammaproteobacteria bacterium]|nr:hypothetical protein [Gammaproteobacteria bacterium]